MILHTSFLVILGGLGAGTCRSALRSCSIRLGKGRGRLVIIDNEGGGVVMLINFNISFGFRMMWLVSDSMRWRLLCIGSREYGRQVGISSFACEPCW